MKYFFVYLAAINVIGYVMMGVDKQKAKKHSWRISEKTLFVIALIGGSIGIKGGMETFRHKTHHKQFVYGVPAIIIFQLAAVLYFVLKLNILNI